MNPQAIRRSLLRAIRANPEDRTVRLVYADWCDEYGTAKQKRHAREIRRGDLVGRALAIHRNDLRNPANAADIDPAIRWLTRQHELRRPFLRVYRGPFLEYYVSPDLSDIAHHARKHPLRAVAWLEKKPVPHSPSPRKLWTASDVSHACHDVPLSVAQYLWPSELKEKANGMYVSLSPSDYDYTIQYESTDDAYAALSKAIILYARSKFLYTRSK